MNKPYILIDGKKYSNLRPPKCHYCYFWEWKKKECTQKECYFLLKQEDWIGPENLPEPGRCPGCPYGRVHICIGYCMVKLLDKDEKK